MKPNIAEAFSNSVKEVLAKLCQCVVETGNSKMKNLSQTFEEITILLEITGKLRGHVIYVMEKKFALELASIMIGIPVEEIEDLALSALAEIGNIITGSAMTKISGLGLYSETNIPRVIIGKDKPLPIIDSLGVIIPTKTPGGNLIIGLSLREY